MPRRALALLAVLLVATLLPKGAAAEPVTLVTCEWPPYIGQELPEYGFTGEILSEAFRRANMTADIRFLPWTRALKSAEAGLYDALASAYNSSERAKYLDASEPYAQTVETLAVLAESGIIYTSLRDLTSFRIGVVRGYLSSRSFNEADYLDKEEVSSDELNLSKLAGGRVDVVLINRDVALWLVRHHPDIMKGRKMRFLSPPLGVRNLRVMFSRKRPGYANRLARFNRALREMRREGEMDRIMRKHGFEPSPPLSEPQAW